MEFVIIFLLLGNLIVTFLLWQKNQQQTDQAKKIFEDQADQLSDQLDYRFEQERQQRLLAQQQLELALGDRLGEVRTDLHRNLTEMRLEISENLTKNRDKTDERMRQIQESNDRRLEQMRQTVEEKLEKTLQTRLQTSFETVSKQLESVNRGLGEMQHVARDVGTLNKVLSNTKTRGILGELQLGQIIEDIMTPSQYEREFATVAGSSERVEYAIKLPGQVEKEYIYLPIDSKFPLADYYRLEDAYESGNKEEIDLYRKSLLASVKRFAKDINKKYLAPPATTNFGVMFLPTEGLYSEVVRRNSLTVCVETSRLWSQDHLRCLPYSIRFRSVLKRSTFKEVQMTSARFWAMSNQNLINLVAFCSRRKNICNTLLAILMNC